MSRYIPEHPPKGSAEAYAWAEKMRAARQKKARLKHQIRQAGLKVEQEFFGPGGPLAPKATRKHSLNPSKSYSLVCQANGCTFHREHLSKKQANQEATGHMNMYGHSVAIVEKNPGAKWHQGEEDVAYRYKKDAKDQLEKAFFAGVEAAHKTSGSAARKMGMNPSKKRRNRKGVLVDSVTLYGNKLAEIYQTSHDTFSVYVGGKIQGSYHTIDEAKELVRFYVHSLSHDNPKKRIRKNPIAVFNPREGYRTIDEFPEYLKEKAQSKISAYKKQGWKTRLEFDNESRMWLVKVLFIEKNNPSPKVAGTIYNNAIEIKAQKTGGPLKGHYKHIFDSKKVKILGLTDGTVLLQHTEGKPLWITEKDYERSGRKH